MKAKLGISPIAWWNDDLPEISSDISLQGCLSEARAAGFVGIETGRRFPTDPQELLALLRQNELALCGGWFSGLLLRGDLDEEKSRIAPQLALFKALDAPCIVYGETDGSIQGVRDASLSTRIVLGDDEIAAYGRKMTALAEWCAEQGMPLAYHHHMGAPIQSEHDIDRLMRHSGSALGLLYDCGHLAFAGGDVLNAIEKHHRRITHVHTKDVRNHVLAGVNETGDSFLDAVLRGAFTVPGDGSLDFTAIIRRLAAHGYEGWFVIEAEQDPALHAPLDYSRKGAMTLFEILTDAGYRVDAALASQ